MNHNPDTVRWFKARSKALLKAYRNGNEAAQTFFWKYTHDPEASVCLQRMQHCVAKSVGFDNWHALLAASEEERLKIIERLKRDLGA